MNSDNVGQRYKGLAVGLVRDRLLALLATILAAGPLTAEIYYIVPGAVDVTLRPTAQLRRVNPDGTGNTPIGLRGIPAPQVPTFSRNGRFLALTSRDPTRPTDQSQSVFELDVLTGQTRRLIFFQDMRDEPVSGPGGKVVFTPSSKAYSPDRRFMALSVVQRTVVRNVRPAEVAGLQIHDLTGGLPVAFLIQAPPGDGVHTSGVGVDWSPDGSRLVYPIARRGPNGIANVTPIYLVDPRNGQVQQFTTPSDAQVSSFAPRIVTTSEHDYSPVFSPNGQALAYVRATQRLDTAVNVLQQPALQVDIRIVSRNGDRSIFTLNAQRDLIANRVSWSPDGTRLVFDVAPRMRTQVGPILQPEPSQLTTLTIGVDGSGVTRVAAPPAAQPVWGAPQRLGPGGPGRLRDLFDPAEFGSAPSASD